MATFSHIYQDVKILVTASRNSAVVEFSLNGMTYSQKYTRLGGRGETAAMLATMYKGAETKIDELLKPKAIKPHLPTPDDIDGLSWLSSPFLLASLIVGIALGLFYLIVVL